MEINFLEQISGSTSTHDIAFSPDGLKIAFSRKQNEIFVLNSQNLTEENYILCANKIEKFFWAPNSKLIAVLMTSRNEISVFSLENRSFPKNQITPPIATISGGYIETESLMWSPTSSHILIFGVHSVHLIVWEIINKGSFRRLVSPKSSTESVSFSPDGSTLAVINRSKSQDILTLYTKEFVRKTSFNLSTLDAKKLHWSPNSQYVVVQDSSDHHLLQVVDVQSSVITSYAAYEGFLGINQIAISPNSVIIALGSFDNIIRLRVKAGANQWKTIEELTHTKEQKHPSVVFAQANGFKREIPYTLPTVAADVNGFSLISWSFDNTFLAAKAEKMPSSVFIWNTKEMASHVVVFDKPVCDVKWSPCTNDLMVTSGQNFVVHWSQKDVDVIEMDNDMIADSIEWAKDGSKLFISDNSAGIFTIGVIPEEE